MVIFKPVFLLFSLLDRTKFLSSAVDVTLDLPNFFLSRFESVLFKAKMHTIGLVF